ncbi:LacI family DNA-binding transcriptional regulator [Psychromonas sp.]|uniref:LacI family DNA-binding transcriptional regulator n=1 Tax=Psychromonas sp. TaxID=1884585 RepID=UPI0035644088
MSTIVDVCKLAGVSKATVSRVINGTGQVKKSTQETVHAAMEQLGFRPNSLAQALAAKQTNSIGLVVSDFQGDYFGTLLKQASTSAEGANKELIVTNGHNDALREYEAIQLLADRKCDAIVLYSRKMTMEQLQKLKQQLSVPLVLINRELSEPLFHSVTFDQRSPVNLMMNHLIAYGHRKIACITGPIETPTTQARLTAYKEVLQQHAIRFNEHLVKNVKYGLQDGYDACQELIKSNLPFSALFAFNDEMALGALKALTDAGIRVPEQVSIAGIDNIPMTKFSHPTISTIDLPIEEVTKHAVEIALKLAAGEQCAFLNQYKGKLLQRDSVLPYHSHKNWLTC